MSKKSYTHAELADFLTHSPIWKTLGWFYDHDVIEPEDWFNYHETEVIAVKPNERVSKDELDYWLISWQGCPGDDPSHGDGMSFRQELDKYQKTKVSTLFQVEIPNDRAEEFKVLVKNLKGSFVK